VLVSFVGVVEIFRTAQIKSAATFNFTPYIAVALVFIVLTIPLARLTDWLVARDKRPRDGWWRAMTAGTMDGPIAAPALRIEGLYKSFGDLEVLRGIDLVVAEHEVVCLIGASGSGKSTLLRCINLLEPIDAGRIVVAGEEITADGRPPRPGPTSHRDRVPGVQTCSPTCPCSTTSPWRRGAC